MNKFYKVPETIRDDISSLKKEVEKLKKGEITSTKFMGFRVPLGIYEQRQSNTYMMRIRIPGGGISASQLRTIGELCKKYNLAPHLTTRQDIQLQNTNLDDLAAIYTELYKIGLTCKGGGGNTVRNITACTFAGICKKETFNVLPYSIGLTEYLIKFPNSYNLPRKFKIAFSGCSEDCAFATMNDLGFIAKKNNGKDGFSVWIAGKMGAYSKAAEKLSDFIGIDEIGNYAEAAKRIFDKFGNRQNKHKARLRFVIDKFGIAEFKKLFDNELLAVKEEGNINLDIRKIDENSLEKGTSPIENSRPSEEFEEWKKTNVLGQNNQKYVQVKLTLPLGDTSGNNLIKLSEIVSGFGEKNIRTTQYQNFILRNIKTEQTENLYNKLKDSGLLGNFRDNINNIVSCKGAATCKLGICLSTGLTKAIAEELNKNKISLAALPEINMKVSGCLNSCGQHPIATIGFAGASRRINNRLAPYYNIYVSGIVKENETKLSEQIGIIPAKNIPFFVSDLLTKYLKNKSKYRDFYQFINTDGKDISVNIANKYSKIPSYEENKDYYIDFDSTSEFSLAGRGPGECGAGVFDMIDSDIQEAKKQINSGNLYNAVLSLSKSLLVIRGIDTTDDTTAFNSFEKQFINTGWISKKYSEAINAAKEKKINDLEKFTELINELAERITILYKSMDSNLQFQMEKEENTENIIEQNKNEDIAHKLDLRGVLCPINYVKTKLYMEELNINEIVEVYLDEGEPVQNTPASLKNDGQEIVKIEKKDSYYSVIIKKKV